MEAFVNTIARGGIFAAACVLGAGAAYAGCTANLTADRELNVRSGPSTNYAPVGKIPGRACGIRIGNCEDGWCRVNYEGIRGYSSETYLRRTGGAENRGDDQQETVEQFLNIAKQIFQQLADDPDWERLGVVEVGRDRDRSVIQLNRNDGRFDRLRMGVRGNDVDIRRIVVVYGNGKRHNLRYRNVVEAGGETGEIELRGQRGRFIDRIIIVHQKDRRRGRPAEIAVWGHKTAEGRGRGNRGQDRIGLGPAWKPLATQTANRERDRDVIQLGRDEGSFNAFRLRAVGNDVRIRRVRVVYGNGNAHNIDIGSRVSEGDYSDPIELRGQKGRFVRRVIVVHDTVSRGPRAKVELWGREQAR